jgi:hypothetical protein
MLDPLEKPALGMKNYEPDYLKEKYRTLASPSRSGYGSWE